MPVVYDQPYASVTNGSVIDNGVTIAATGVRLTNTNVGRIYGGITFTIGGSTLDNWYAGWIGTSDNVITGPLIIGSDGADTILNSGIIAGSIALGDGNDLFVARSRSSGHVDLGAGNDTYRVEGPDTAFIDAEGGAGIDQLVLAGFAGRYWASVITGFEQLVFEDGGTFDRFSGFQSIEIRPFSTTRPYVELVNSSNPTADVALNSSWLMLTDSLVRSVVANGAANSVDLVNGASVSNGIWLGEGDDTLTLRSINDGGIPTLPSIVDGGGGIDTLLLQWINPGDRSFDLFPLSGFERLNVNFGFTTNQPATARVSNANGLRDIDIGLETTLVLTAGNFVDARVFAHGGGGVTIARDITIDRYGFDERGPWDFRLDIALADSSKSTIIVNQGRITHDVRFYVGDDFYDGRDGAVGGTVYGNAGNDRLLGGSAAERFVGGYGDDTLQGGGGADILTGGAGSDLFSDTKAGHDGDTITDFGRGDRLVFTDATVDGFFAQMAGTTLKFAGGSLTLEGVQNASLSATAAAGGGVQVTFASPPLVISGGAAVTIGKSAGLAQTIVAPAPVDTMTPMLSDVVFDLVAAPRLSHAADYQVASAQDVFAFA